MSKICSVTGKKPLVGHKVSHANNKTKKRSLPNLQTHRFWSETQKKFIALRVSTRAMRKIDKIGIDAALLEFRPSKFSSKKMMSNRTKKRAIN